MKDLLERPFDQAITSKYTAMNGWIYFAFGALVIIRPGMVQTISGMRRSLETRQH